MMMTGALEDAVGSQWRDCDRSESHRADRHGAILYTVSSRAASTGIGPRWSETERWLLDGNAPDGMRKCFAGETVTEVPTELELAPHSHPGIVRVAALAYEYRTPRVVVVEPPRSQNHFTMAVLSEHLERAGYQMLTWPWKVKGDPITVTARLRTDWVLGSGQTNESLQRCVRELQVAAKLDRAELLRERGGDFVMMLGTGPVRDATYAREVAAERHAAGWWDLHIQEYLRLYGFTNLSGTVGVWNHSQFTRLMHPETQVK